jgi:hypothetical protein
MNKFFVCLLVCLVLVPIASACTYPTCTGSSASISSIGNNNATFSTGATTISGSAVSASAVFAVSFNSGYDEITVTINDITDGLSGTNKGISAIGFILGPTAPTSAQLLLPSGGSVGIGPYDTSGGSQIEYVEPTTDATVGNSETVSFENKDIGTNGSFTIANVFVVYGPVSNFTSANTTDIICANTMTEHDVITTPEPGSILLMGCGLLFIPFLGRKIRRRT